MKQQVEVKDLKEGKYVIIDDEACIIKSITKSKPGKHGAAKARIEAIGLFDGQKRSYHRFSCNQNLRTDCGKKECADYLNYQ